ncbi:ubiquitin fusion degradation protein-like protein [Ophiobolus disseminans]|uniref:Ubiquitin fusion degradation protein-like protein n=1 Tax=Ophiobolus disseminans TaxID=1469910 RepID=A0A6A7A7G4_9PLEO|nr:ubiquitin fusion degradation protein-like protein [Ophiobolus disseminans]
MDQEQGPADLKWSAQYTLSSTSRGAQLPGDKMLLPPSALEQLLAAAPTITIDNDRPHITSFDPFNPYTYDAERQARAQVQDRYQQLPHPLTFKLVNPENNRVLYAGIREFSAEEGQIVLSSFLREALGIEEPSAESSRRGTPGGDNDGNQAMANGLENSAGPKITVHAKQLPKGTFVKLRPLEAGYDPEDWKSLLEEHLRSNFTTLTNGEVLVVYGGRGVNGKREEFRFLVDGFKPKGDAVLVIDTDLEVDIEALNEDQARETLKTIAAKRHRAPGTDEGSSVGGIIDIFRAQDAQVLEGEYVDFELPSWDRSQGLEISLGEVDDDAELDLFISPYSSRQRVRPREYEHVFAELSSRHPKSIRLQPTNAELDEAEAIYISVRAYPSDTPTSTPIPFRLNVSMFDPKTSTTTNGSNEKEDAHGPDDTTTCPGKLILCRFCHLQVPQEGDPTEPASAELLLSGLTPHELADGGRTTECHLCNKIVRFRDMETHLRHHDLERLSRPTPRLCRNVNCGRTQDGANKMGDTRAGTRKGQGPGNEIGLCSVCYGPLYVSMHDPEGKALRRRIERRYLSQLLTGCGKAWCRNEYCRTGRKNLGQGDKSVSTKDAIPMVKPLLEGMDGRGYTTPLHFCVDERSQKNRTLAEMMTAERGIEGKGGYALEWCTAALEAEGGNLDKGQAWLKGWAPQRIEAGQ